MENMKLEKWSYDQNIPENLTLMENYLDRHKDEKPFENWNMILIQHQVGNLVPQVAALIKLGLDKKKLYILDIPYSSSEIVKKHIIEKLGVPEENIFINNYKILQPYAKYQRRRTQELVISLLKNPPEKLVVLDDGAYFIEALATFKQKLPLVVIVEQTTRGITKINKNAAISQYADNLTLINVAESAPKKTLEPFIIAYAICERLRNKLKDKFACKSHKCLVLGFGTIGNKVAELLKKSGYDQIYVFDTNYQKLREAVKKKYIKWDKQKDISFDLVVACSGTSSFGIGDYVFLKDGAVLASASSGSVELSREEFIELAASHEGDDIILNTEGLDETSIHSDLNFELVGRNVTFLNGGFPINFYGVINCIPAHYIQPTPVMMVEAARLATKISTPGQYKFHSSFCKRIKEEFEKELGEKERFIIEKTN